MSFNNWDKLVKAQRDYPKAKAAVPFVEKQLKRNANNPYLLAWKAELALQRNSDPHEIEKLLSNLYGQTLPDGLLLAYIYQLHFETRQRTASYLRPEDKGTYRNSNGQDAIKCWQSAAKTFQRPNDRLGLWNTLFKSAVQEGAWEDARYAIMNYSKEGPPNKKHYQFLLALTSRFAIDRKSKDEDREAHVLRLMALQYLKKSFAAPSDDPVAMKEIKDLRFMADMFIAMTLEPASAKENSCEALFDLWKNPPEHLVPLFKRHRDDVLSMMTRAARKTQNWSLLVRHCTDIVDEKLLDSNETGQNKSKIWELCAWNVDTWDALIAAARATRSAEEASNNIKEQLDKVFGSALTASNRPLRLTRMKLRQAAGEQLLPDCKEYFEHHGRLPSCFEDLRPFITTLSLDDSRDFVRSIESRLQEQHIETLPEEKRDNWLQSQFHLLKFQHMIEASLAVDCDIAVKNALLKSVLKLSQAWHENSDTGYLAVYTLLSLHHSHTNTQTEDLTFDTRNNCRYLLQAAMYTRYVVEKDKEKHNRTMALLAARLHLNLGLGTVGFRLYGHAKCKEMLLDTLSPYVLARISQTHPFTASSYGSFSAEEELARVIGTIERMEKKTDDILIRDVPAFLWDSAMQSLQLKRKLQSSLTRHLCIVERRRIARLKGESTESLPKATIQSYHSISNNWDQSVFPSFEPHPENYLHLNVIMPNAPPNVEVLMQQHFQNERVNELLYREIDYADFEPAGDYDNYMKHTEKSPLTWTRIEQRLQPFWIKIEKVLRQIRVPETVKTEDANIATELLSHMRLQKESVAELCITDKSPQVPEDEPSMFHENMFMACYGVLELCRGVNKLVEQLRDEVIQPKTKSKTPHPLKNKLLKNYESDLQKVTQECYQAVRDVAQSYIDLLMKRGSKSIIAQVRSGETGEALKEILSDDDVEYYANEYVNSALEAWKGVLKVKLK